MVLYLNADLIRDCVVLLDVCLSISVCVMYVSMDLVV